MRNFWNLVVDTLLNFALLFGGYTVGRWRERRLGRNISSAERTDS